MLTDVIVEEGFDHNEEELWYSRKDLEHGEIHEDSYSSLYSFLNYIFIQNVNLKLINPNPK